MPEDGAVTFLRVIALAVIFGVAGCASSSDPLSTNPDYEWVVTDAEYRRRLQDWFNCDECVNGQLRRVQELGDYAVNDLNAAKDGTMIQVSGFDIALADNDANVATRCTRFTTGLPGTLTTAVTTADCIRRFQENRDRRFKSRAREALIAIRTKRACSALGGDVCRDIKAFFPPVYGIEGERSIRKIAVP